MKRLLQYGKGYGRQAVLAPLFKMLEASFELFVPLVVAAVIDTGIRRQDIGYILRMSGLLVLLAVIGLTCSITAQYFAAKTAVGFATPCLPTSSRWISRRRTRSARPPSSPA